MLKFDVNNVNVHVLYSIIYAILSPDSSIVYYRVSKGMIPPLKLKNAIWIFIYHYLQQFIN